MLYYVALIRHVHGGHVSVSFPDLPGCSVKDVPLAAAMTAASEVLSKYLTRLVATGHDLPKPRTFKHIANDQISAGAVVTLVGARID